jgi:hypothetical protein
MVDGDGSSAYSHLKSMLRLTFLRTRIFIIEGAITATIALVSKFFIVDWPETCKFLTEEEKRLLVARLAADVGDAKMNRLDKRAAKRIFGDWKMYVGTLIYMGIVNTGYATSFFTPTIITE